MPDREKVIAMLKCIANLETVYMADCKRRECPYAGTECTRAVAADALVLLKEQEARVLSLEEVKQHDNKNNCVWFELPNNIIAAVFVIQDRTQTGIISPYVNSEPLILHLYWNNTNYGRTWRCWSVRPTDEQRRTVKWDE